MKKFKDWADKNLQGDRVIWAVVFALSLISILVVYSSIGTLAYKRSSSTESYLLKHTFMVVLGLGAMWVAHKIDYRYYSKLSRLALWVSVPLLLYTFKFGTTLNDAARWITLPIINTSFQPSDFASLALIINLASMLSKKQQNIDDIKEALIKILTDEKEGKTALDAILAALRAKAVKGDVKAAQELLDRAFGKSKQIIESEVEIKNKGIIKWGDTEIQI